MAQVARQFLKEWKIGRWESGGQEGMEDWALVLSGGRGREGEDIKGRRSFFLFPHTCTFQLLDKPWSQVSFLLTPASCL